MHKSNTPSVDMQDVNRFLTDLYPSEGRPEYSFICCVYMMPGNPDDNFAKYYSFEWFDLQRLSYDIQTISLERNAYLIPMLRSRREGGRKLDAFTKSKWIWADLDRNKADPAKAIPEELKPYSMIVNSGTEGNEHLYIQLDRYYDTDTIERYNKALYRMLNADPKHANNALLRVAGTFNHKHYPAKPVSLAHRAERPLLLGDAEKIFARWLKDIPKGIRFNGKELREVPLVTDPGPLIKLKQYEVPDGTGCGDKQTAQGRSGQSYGFIRECLKKMKPSEAYTRALKHPPTMSKWGGDKKKIMDDVKRIYDLMVEEALGGKR